MQNRTALRRYAHIAALVAMALLGTVEATAQTPLPGRIEILPVRSKTLTAEEFLCGTAPGRDVLPGGELRLPFNVPGKVPAVVLVHGSGGITSAVRRCDRTRPAQNHKVAFCRSTDSDGAKHGIRTKGFV